MADIKKEEFAFGNGNKATAVFPAAGDPAPGIYEALSLPIPKAVIVAIGGADDLDETLLPRLRQLFRGGLGKAAIESDAVIIDGGTNAGVMSLVGEAVAACGAQTNLVGVAPLAKVVLPADASAGGTELEPNHTHFVLTQGTDWGSETPILFDLVRWLGRGPVAATDKREDANGPLNLPVVAVLAGGGSVTKTEVMRVVRLRIPLIVIEGSGGYADEIAAAGKQKIKDVEDPDLAEIVSEGELHFHPITNSVKGLGRLLIRVLGVDKVLMQAWETFALYDENANRQQRRFNKIQLLIIFLGVIGTTLVVIQQVFAPRGTDGNLEKVRFEWGGKMLWWLIYYLLILIPILLTVFITAANRFKQGNKWLLLRAGAEAIKREIYSYRVRDISNRLPAEQVLAKKVEDITRRTMRTEVNLTSLRPYDPRKGFPPCMFASGGADDGFSFLTPDRYVDVRLADQLRYYSKKSVRLEQQLRIIYWLTFAIGGAGAFLAAVGEQVWIAVTTSVVVSLGTYLGYRQTENTLMKYNQTATDLANIKGWWNALSAEDQADAANIASLVRHTEKVLQTELDGWIQQMQNALQELRKSQESAASQKKEAADDEGQAAEGSGQKTDAQPGTESSESQTNVTATVRIVRDSAEPKEEIQNGSEETKEEENEPPPTVRQ